VFKGLMIIACLEAELLDSEVSGNSKHGIVQVAALPIHRNALPDNL